MPQFDQVVYGVFSVGLIFFGSLILLVWYTKEHPNFRLPFGLEVTLGSIFLVGRFIWFPVVWFIALLLFIKLFEAVGCFKGLLIMFCGWPLFALVVFKTWETEQKRRGSH